MNGKKYRNLDVNEKILKAKKFLPKVEEEIQNKVFRSRRALSELVLPNQQ
jgi:hypothetical protein